MPNQALEDELLAVGSIYPDCILPVEGSSSTYAVQIYSPAVDAAHVADGDHKEGKHVVYRFFLAFPPTYPDSAGAAVRVSDVEGIDRARLEGMLQVSAGQEVLFELLSQLHELAESEPPLDYRSTGQLQGELDASATEGEADDTAWVVGEAVQDRKSVMLGRAIRVRSLAEVDAALESVRRDRRLARATHPAIYAYRFTAAAPAPSSGAAAGEARGAAGAGERVVHDHDDDGESGAGGRLAFLLGARNESNTLVVVTRWFGGILLGDVRFKHITTAARDALDRLRASELG